MDKEAHAGITGEELNAIRVDAMQFAGIGVYRFKFDGTILFMDRGALRILDLEEAFPNPEEVVGKNVSDLIVYEGPRGLLRSEISKNGHIRDFAYPFKTLTGKRRCALHDSYLAKDRVTGEEVLQVIIRDITKMRDMEEAMAEERERLIVTLRSIGDGVISTDADGRILLLNKQAELLTGWRQEEAIGKGLPEVFRIVNEFSREPVPDPVQKVMESGMVVGLANHTVLIAKDGTERAIADSGAPIFDKESRMVGVVLVFRDVGAERQMEEAKQRTEKLESLGLLAGGIAHDFNNYLTAILGNISLATSMLSEDGPGSEVSKILKDAQDSSLLARGLTEQLLTFARGGAPVKRVLELPELIRKGTEFALSGSSVRAEISVAENLWPVEADPGQFARVMDNIVINANQAMPTGGVLKVDAINVRVKRDEIENLAEGGYVCISVKDHGVGIHPSQMSKLFDPYFTTKENGLGLGLATAFSILRKHHGAIQVQSKPGVGSTFSIYLPACKAQPADERPEESVSRKGEGRILLMDDKDFVLQVGGRILSFLGYTVECVTDGQKAIAAYEKSLKEENPFDAVILDLTVSGGMGGREALGHLVKMNPDVCAIASSGYANDPVMSDCASYGFKGFITKPYTLDTVAETLSRILHD